MHYSEEGMLEEVVGRGSAKRVHSQSLITAACWIACCARLVRIFETIMVSRTNLTFPPPNAHSQSSALWQLFNFVTSKL